MGEAESIVSGGEMAFEKLFDEAFEYAVPLITGVAGFLAGPTFIGGTGNLYNALNPALSPYTGRVMGVLLGGICLVAGGALWSFGKEGSIWKKALGRGVGSFLIGSGLSYLWNLTVMNASGFATQGILDKATSAVENFAGGGST